MKKRRKGKIIAFAAILLMGFYSCQKEVPHEKVLFDFEQDSELDRLHWKCHTLFSLSHDHATHGSKCLRLEMYPSLYPGVTPILQDHDWSRFKALAFDVYNPEAKEIELTVRIDDKKGYPEYEDRYNKGFVLRQGKNQIEIPVETLATSGTRRKLDARTIYRLVIFVVNPAVKTELYLDYM